MTVDEVNQLFRSHQWPEIVQIVRHSQITKRQLKDEKHLWSRYEDSDETMTSGTMRIAEDILKSVTGKQASQLELLYT